MSNEELVILIQEGNEEYIPQLWEQVCKWVYKRAYIFFRKLSGKQGVELEDIKQAGYLGFLSAITSYAPDKGAFVTWLTFNLLTPFREAAGYPRSAKLEPLNMAVSLAAPLNGAKGDDEDFTLEAAVADPINPFENVEERIYTEQLHTALEAVISTLPEDEEDVIRLYYFEGVTTQKLSERAGCTANEMDRLRHRALEQMRKMARTTRAGKNLRQFIELRTPYYNHIGVNGFNSSHTSAVERAVLRREELQERYSF